ncbi:MAG TPA: DUF5336 domain-containing protein [Nakamurella sp.]
MHGPDDYRGAPSGGSWRPAGTDPFPGAPSGWAPGAQRPGPTWSAAVTGPGGQYVAPGAAGPSAPPGSTTPARLEPAKLFGIVIAALGAANFAFGFLPQVTASRIDETLSVYAVGPGYVPILLLIAGLLALAAFLPGSERSRLAVAAVSVGGAVGALISLGTTGSVEMLTSAQVSKGLGAVLLTIFGIIQAVVAIAGYVVGADLGHRSGSTVVATIAPDPAVGPSPASAPVMGATAGDVVWTADGPVRSTPWSAPGSTAAPPSGSVAYYAGYAPHPGASGSGWSPSADDRPTGPQPVVDPNADAPDGHSRQAPAERELPRVAPAFQDPASAPADGKTEVNPIPPRPSEQPGGPSGSAGSAGSDR